MASEHAAGAPPEVEQRVLDNGLRVICAPMPHTRSATVSFYLGAGARYERDELAGISHLVEHCVFKGTRARRRAAEISAAIEGVGGLMNAATDRELTVYYAKVPAPHFGTAVDVISELVCRPLFEEAELEKERLVILEELAAVEDSPGQLAGLLMDSLLWPGTPAGRDIAGTPDSVSAIAHAETVAYWRRQYAPRNGLISVAGALDADEACELAERLTADWEFAEPEPPLPAPLSAEGGRFGFREKEAEQAHIVIGLPTVDPEHPDRFAMSLLVGILGDGMSSRLFERVREQLGLAYDVHAFGAAMSDSGAMQIYLGVDPDNAEAALRAALEVLGGMREGVSEAELERAREYACGRRLLQMEDTRSVSSWNGAQALLRDRIRSVEEVDASFREVESADIRRLAGEYIQEDRLRLAVVGPAAVKPAALEAALRLP